MIHSIHTSEQTGQEKDKKTKKMNEKVKMKKWIDIRGKKSGDKKYFFWKIRLWAHMKRKVEKKMQFIFFESYLHCIIGHSTSTSTSTWSKVTDLITLYTTTYHYF